MSDTPKGMRRHIVIAGRCNAGKSRLFNALAREEIAIISSTPGTTADPVEKALEIAPLGPVVLIDTAGIDDAAGSLGRKRASRSLDMLGRADMAILVTNGEQWGNAEAELAARLQADHTPFVVARNKSESGLMPVADWRRQHGLPGAIACVDVSARENLGLEALLTALAALDAGDDARPFLADLVPANGLVLMAVPIDSGAPKGRLILPQVQAIRDCLDGGVVCMVAREKELARALEGARPDLAVCDSQVVRMADALIPPDIPLTTFSILMARLKGDLSGLAVGARALAGLQPGDAVLIQEACSHHAQKDDIGRVKIPALLHTLAGGDLDIRFAQGRELAPYDPGLKAIIHCGGCMLTPAQMRVRQTRAGNAGIPMTNYGMTIALCQGILPRVLAPFPEALAVFRGIPARDLGC